jgi:hypothetical protein
MKEQGLVEILEKVKAGFMAGNTPAAIIDMLRFANRFNAAFGLSGVSLKGVGCGRWEVLNDMKVAGFVQATSDGLYSAIVPMANRAGFDSDIFNTLVEAEAWVREVIDA